MNLRRLLMILICATLLVGISSNESALAQSSDQPNQTGKAEDEANLDTQLYLIVATNQEVEDTKTPAALDSVLKKLRSSLAFKHYRVSATLINRVKNNGRLSLKWIGGPLIASAADSSRTPSFNEFRVNNVKLVRDAQGQEVVRMEGFSFGARIPIQSGTAVASAAPSAPIINYENTGLNTDISMRENDPVIVGTVNVGPSGDAIILVISVKRAGN